MIWFEDFFVGKFRVTGGKRSNERLGGGDSTSFKINSRCKAGLYTFSDKGVFLQVFFTGRWVNARIR
jgi:hypothetical protein